MENWSNLNIYLTRATEDHKRIESLGKELIDFCIGNDKTNIKKMLKTGAPINCHEEHITPLIACMQNNNSDLASYLLKSGARVSYKPTTNFEDAFWFALSNQKYIFLQLFISNRCILEWSVPKTEKETPQTALIYSTIKSDLKAVEILLGHYAIKVNERDGLGNTALHHNVSKSDMSQDDIEIGKLLLAAGADTSIANLDGKTPEDMAQDYTSKSMLLAGKLAHDLPEKDESELENVNDMFDSVDSGVHKTKKGKMKI